MAALGARNQIARHVMDDLMDFSEAQTARNLFAQLNALIAEMEALKDQEEAEEEIKMKEAQLESMVPILSMLPIFCVCQRYASARGPFFILDKLTEVAESSCLPNKMKVVFDQARSEEKAFASLMKDLSLSLWISVSKKRRLVAEVEVLVERGDPSRPLEHIRVIVARDLETVVEDYRLAREINRVTVEVYNVVSARAKFIEELDSLGVRHVPTKPAQFQKEIQLKDRETMAQLQILEKEMKFNDSKKELFIKKIKGP
nr:hypothetical protein [Tanacetum cinerariifolium]